MDYVLIVEAEIDLRILYKETLAFEGIRAIGANGADHAWQLLETAQVLPSLIVLNLTMPRLSGWEFLRKLQTSAYANIPVVATAGFRKADLPENVVYMARPIDLRGLVIEAKKHLLSRYRLQRM